MANEKFKVKFGLAVGDTAATVDGTTGDIVTAGDVAVNGGDITTTSTTANIVNATATTVNIGGAGTTVSIGANTGTTTVNNSLVADDISVTTVDTTNLEVTNIKAKDGTAAIIIADSTGAVSVSTQLSVDNINIATNTISSTDTNGAITLDPNGTGNVVCTFSNGGNLTNDRNYVAGAIRNATTAAAGDIWNFNTTGLVGPTRGISLDNSADTTKNVGTILRSYSGSAASGQRPRLVFEKARNTVASPSANAAADVLGGVEATGYSSTGWVNDTISAAPGNFVFVCNEAWTSNTNLGTGFVMNLAPTATTISTAANLVQALNINPQLNQSRSDNFTWGLGKSATTFSATGSSISGTTLTIGTVTTGTVAVGQYVQTATLGVLFGTYIVSNISGSGSGSTWVVSQTQTVTSTTITGTSGNMYLDSSSNLTVFGDVRINGNNIQGGGGLAAIDLTSANTSTTVRGDTINLINAASTTTYAQFASGGHTFGNVDAPVTLNRTTAGTPGVPNTKASYNIEARRSDQAGVTDGDSVGAGFRVGGTGNFYWTHNQSSQYDSAGDHPFQIQAADGDRTAGAVWLNVFETKPTATTIYAGTVSSGGGGSTSAKLTVDAAKITAAVPIAFPNYTVAAAGALTGAVGQQIAISNSSTSPSQSDDGMMAYWATNGTPQWRYIHNNGAL